MGQRCQPGDGLQGLKGIELMGIDGLAHRFAPAAAQFPCFLGAERWGFWLGLDLVGLGHALQTDVASPELLRAPGLAVIAQQRPAGLDLVAELLVADGAVAAFMEALAGLSNLEKSRTTQLSGLALFDRAEVAVADRREAGLLAPVRHCVLGPAVALPPQPQHAPEDEARFRLLLLHLSEPIGHASGA